MQLYVLNIHDFMHISISNILFEDCNSTLQAPWNTLTYSIIGSTSAQQYFGIDSSTGGLYVKKDLRTTSISRFLIEVRAVDGGDRDSLNNAFRTVNIIRNNFSPAFPDGSCDLTVNALGVGTVLRLTATDSDRSCSHGNVTYSIEGDEAAKAAFGINAQTGEVFRRSGLANLGVQTMYLR